MVDTLPLSLFVPDAYNPDSNPDRNPNPNPDRNPNTSTNPDPSPIPYSILLTLTHSLPSLTLPILALIPASDTSGWPNPDFNP